MELNTTTLAIFPVAAALGIIGVIGVSVLSTQEIDARRVHDPPGPPPTQGCWVSTAANASQGECFQGVR